MAHVVVCLVRIIDGVGRLCTGTAAMGLLGQIAPAHPCADSHVHDSLVNSCRTLALDARVSAVFINVQDRVLCGLCVRMATNGCSRLVAFKSVVIHVQDRSHMTHFARHLLPLLG